jgi:hypothetical protein
MPPLPQVVTAPGAHTPSPLHANHADHCPVDGSHVRLWDPQFPHVWVVEPVHT